MRKRESLYYLLQYVDKEIHNTIIHLAVKRQKSESLAIILEELINAPQDLIQLLNKLNSYGDTALMDAARTGHVQIFKLLINAGADLNLCNRLGNTVAHVAALNGHLEILKVIVEN